MTFGHVGHTRVSLRCFTLAAAVTVRHFSTGEFFRQGRAKTGTCRGARPAAAVVTRVGNRGIGCATRLSTSEAFPSLAGHRGALVELAAVALVRRRHGLVVQLELAQSSDGSFRRP